MARPRDFEIRFRSRADGETRELEFTQPGPDVILDRDEPRITYGELRRLVQEAYGQIEEPNGLIRFRGDVAFTNQGARGDTVVEVSQNGEHRTSLDFGDMATMELAAQPQGISASEPSKCEADDAKFHYPWLVTQDWTTRYPGHLIEAGPTTNGESTYSLSLFEPGTLWPSRVYLISSKTGLILREQRWLCPDGTFELIEYSDFRRVHGAVFPFRHISTSDLLGEMVLELKSSQLAE